MGGSNPFIEEAQAQLPEQAYSITFMPEGKVVQVDPGKLPYSRDGLPGSILEIATGHDIEIDHACGGVCACSTCHVVIQEGFDSCNEATEDEEDQLDLAPGLNRHSRLACQCVPNGKQNVVVEIPEWNRNLVSEEH